MGIERGTYVGIYLEIPYYTKEVIKKYFVDPNTGVKQSTRFNPVTGVENIPKEETKTYLSRPESCIEDNDNLSEDMFFVPEFSGGGKNVVTFILNARNKYSKSYDGDDVYNIDLSSVNTNLLIEEFKVEYKDYIEYYIQKYNQVSIKYGIVLYAH